MAAFVKVTSFNVSVPTELHFRKDMGVQLANKTVHGRKLATIVKLKDNNNNLPFSVVNLAICSVRNPFGVEIFRPSVTEFNQFNDNNRGEVIVVTLRTVSDVAADETYKQCNMGNPNQKWINFDIIEAAVETRNAWFRNNQHQVKHWQNLNNFIQLPLGHVYTATKYNGELCYEDYDDLTYLHAMLGNTSMLDTFAEKNLRTSKAFVAEIASGYPSQPLSYMWKSLDNKRCLRIRFDTHLDNSPLYMMKLKSRILFAFQLTDSLLFSSLAADMTFDIDLMSDNLTQFANMIDFGSTDTYLVKELTKGTHINLFQTLKQSQFATDMFMLSIQEELAKFRKNCIEQTQSIENAIQLFGSDSVSTRLFAISQQKQLTSKLKMVRDIVIVEEGELKNEEAEKLKLLNKVKQATQNKIEFSSKDWNNHSTNKKCNPALLLHVPKRDSSSSSSSSSSSNSETTTTSFTSVKKPMEAKKRKVDSMQERPKSKRRDKFEKKGWMLDQDATNNYEQNFPGLGIRIYRRFSKRLSSFQINYLYVIGFGTTKVKEYKSAQLLCNAARLVIGKKNKKRRRRT